MDNFLNYLTDMYVTIQFLTKTDTYANPAWIMTYSNLPPSLCHTVLPTPFVPWGQSLSLACKFACTMLKMSRSCWIPTNMYSYSTILMKFVSKINLKQLRNIGLSGGPQQFQSCPRGFDTLNLEKKCFRTLIQRSSKQQQLDKILKE